jgi:hypothetical protein
MAVMARRAKKSHPKTPVTAPCNQVLELWYCPIWKKTPYHQMSESPGLERNSIINNIKAAKVNVDRIGSVFLVDNGIPSCFD